MATMASSKRSKGVSFGFGDEMELDADEFAGQQATEPEPEEEENPFTLPDASEMATYRDRERAERSAERERQTKLKVYEKLGNRLNRLRVADAVGPDEDADDFDAMGDAPRNEKAHELAIKTRDRHIEKEQLQDYIQKKRDMFLVQYALEVKSQEIKKLEEIAKAEEAGLERAEEQLESDAAKFDQFLKDNDKNSAEAIREAEEQTKLKVEKAGEIKALQSEIATLRSDISKNEDSLSELHTFRSFLNSLAPEDWLGAEDRTFMEARNALLDATGHGRGAAADDDLSTAGPDTYRDSSGREIRGSGPPQPSPSNPHGELELDALEVWEPKLFFSTPRQLLDIYAELEAHNLSLITNGQETEEALQDLEERIQSEEAKMAHEREFLQSQIEGLEKEIQREEDLAWLAMERHSYFQSANVDKQEEEMSQLDQKVADVYLQCIGENEANISTLQMLTNIENRLEELFESIAKMPPEKVEEAERAKEKQRRLRAREEKIEQQRVHQEERVRRALERAQAAPKKQTGRRLVFRSAPPKQKKLHLRKRVMATEEEEEMRYYFS